ncbi:MAG: CotH kinase family protein [Clostridia bacterium]|nr:CotH kinase family protein [Clostridia bacterium]
MVKRMLALTVALLGIVFVLVGCNSEPEPADITVKVEYKATTGGTVQGEATQIKVVKEGQSAYFNMVTAVASPGYRFVGWSDGTEAKFHSAALTKSAVITANFEKIENVVITYEAAEGGRILGAPSQTLEKGGTTALVQAKADTGWRFIGWSDGVTTDTRTDTADDNKTITALFSNKVKVVYQAAEGGTILGEITQNRVIGTSTNQVQVVAKSGYRFIGWDDGRTDVRRSDVATDEVVHTALFLRYYKLDITYDQARGILEGSTHQNVDEGAKCATVTAVPLAGYDFVCWSNGSKDPVLSIELTEDTELEAFFSYESHGLPVISIDTATGGDVTSKTEYIVCEISVYDTEGDYHVFNQDAKIRGRGNSTWGWPKKPYKFKFDMKRDLFGFGKAKDWVLMADYGDQSLLRNCLAYQTARELGALVSSPDCQSVEVYLNGEYHGIYLLCEQIEVNENRVDVSKDTTTVDTGYLIEMDGWAGTYNESDPWITAGDQLNANRRYTIKFPDEEGITDAHKDYIKGYIDGCMEILYNGGTYEEVQEQMDVQSFAEAYIISELFKCADVDYSSFYLYKDAGGKLVCGPAWDYDMACGNSNHKGGDVRRYDYLWAKNKNPWYKGLLNFKEFEELVAKTLYENEKLITDTINGIYDYAYDHSEAYEYNFTKWKILGQQVGFNPWDIANLTTWKAHVEYTRTFVKNSMAFLKKTYPYTSAEQ